MKTLLTASALIVALAAPAFAQTSDMGDSDSSRFGGIVSNDSAQGSDANYGIDTTTTQSIGPGRNNPYQMGRDDSSPMREDVDDNDSRAVGGRGN